MGCGQAASPKIFVVEDDLVVRHAIKGLLQIHGFDVEEFGSTADLVSQYKKPS